MNKRTENPDTFVDDPVTALKNDASEMIKNCIECGSCYIDCAFENYSTDIEKCKKWIVDSNDFIDGQKKEVDQELITATFKCAECNKCHNSCPEGIYRRHGNMAMKHKLGNTFKHNINLHPYQNYKVKQPLIESFVISKWNDEQKEWYSKLNQLKEADVLLYHGCYVYLQADQCIKLEKMLDASGVTYASFGKLEYCCGSFGFYRGKDDMSSIKPRLIDMVIKVKPKRIISNCGHCYNAMCDLVNNDELTQKPEVRHAAEELLELNLDKKIEFAHLDKNITIHDSCNFRNLHSESGPLRSFIRKIGNIHEMLSHGENSKCCGDVSKYYAADHINANNRKTKRREFIATKTQNMLTVCAGCFENYHKDNYLKSMDLIDFAYESFAVARKEDALKENNKSQIFEWENMYPKDIES